MHPFPIVSMFDLEINLSNCAYIPYYVISSIVGPETFSLTGFWQSDNAERVNHREERVPQAREQKYVGFPPSE